VAISWAASADKHGVPHEDALHAIEHAVYVEVEFDEPRLVGRVRPTLLIAGSRGLHIFHVMQARKKHLDRMGEI
jgi:hypothetical protein